MNDFSRLEGFRMSKCDIRLEFDRENRTYKGGEIVKGLVYVRVNKEVECKDLMIRLFWQTHGKGNKDSETVSEKTESASHWEAHQEYTYPFQFQLPAIPLTYHGHYINIDTYIQARVGISWGKDPKVTEEVLVQPGVEVEKDTKDTDSLDLDASMGRKRKALRDFLPNTITSVLAVLFVILVLIYLLPIIGLILLIGLVSLNKEIRSVCAERRLGTVQVNLERERAYPGQTFFVQVAFSAIQPVSVESIYAVVQGQEICSSGSGTSVRNFNHVLFKENIELSSTNQNEYQGKIKIPDTNAYSFEAPDNHIKWLVKIYVKIPRWPDWQKEFPIKVVHRPASITSGIY